MAENYTIILTYDISRAGSQDHVNAYVKGRMIELGYSDRFIYTETGKTIHLPNTTLIKENTDCPSARRDLQACVAEFNLQNKTNHKAERIFALEFEGRWAAIEGEPHKSDSLSPRI